MNVFKTSLLATALIAGGMIAPAHADTATADFKVTITIKDACTVTAKSIDFGTQTANAGTVLAQGTVTVECSNGLDYGVSLSGGRSGDISARRMDFNSQTIAYQLYQDIVYNDVWGDGTTGVIVSGTGTGFGSGAPFEKSETVYARATILGTELAGTYSDTVTATVTF